MVTEEQKRQFCEQGYFILPDLFSTEEMNNLMVHIDPFVEEHEVRLRAQSEGSKSISRVGEISFTAFLAEHDPAIMRFVAQKKFVDLASDLLQADIELYWNQAVYKRPGTPREFPWHQDDGYKLTDPAEYVTCWLALGDVPAESGAVQVIPGSHRQGAVEHKDTPIGLQCYFGDDPGLVVPLSQGSMVVFSSLLFHRTGPNLTHGIRKGYVIQFSVAGTKDAESGKPFNRTVIARAGQPVLV